MKKCWECDITGIPLHNHHPVPRSRGGTRTIPLCESCHSKAHHRKKNMNTSALVKEAMAKRKARGAVFGNPNILTDAHPIAIKAIKSNAKSFNDGIKSIVDDLRKEGYTSTQSLVDRLNSMGIKNRSDEIWTYHNLYRIISA